MLRREWLAKENHPEPPDTFGWERNKNNQLERTAAEGQHLFYFFRTHIWWTYSLKSNEPGLDFREAAFNPIRLGLGQKREGQTEG